MSMSWGEASKPLAMTCCREKLLCAIVLAKGEDTASGGRTSPTAPGREGLEPGRGRASEDGGLEWRCAWMRSDRFPLREPECLCSQRMGGVLRSSAKSMSSWALLAKALGVRGPVVGPLPSASGKAPGAPSPGFAC